MKKRTLIFAAIATILIAVPFAYAQHMRGHGGHRMGGELGPVMMLGHLDHARELLGLSDQQVTDIKAIFQDLHAQNAQSRQQLHSGLKSIAETLIANPNDIAAAQALLDKQDAAEHALKVNALNAAAKALNVLTPDQRAKLGQKLRDHAARFEEK